MLLTLAFTGVATLAPLVHSQLVTGTLVNAALFAAVMLMGFRAAAAVALVPSLIALAVGTLPVAMAAMIPYIMASNVALAGVFALLKRTNSATGCSKAPRGLHFPIGVPSLCTRTKGSTGLC